MTGEAEAILQTIRACKAEIQTMSTERKSFSFRSLFLNFHSHSPLSAPDTPSN